MKKDTVQAVALIAARGGSLLSVCYELREAGIAVTFHNEPPLPPLLRTPDGVIITNKKYCADNSATIVGDLAIGY